VERGLAYRLERRPLMAMADFGAALKLKPDDAEALMARGNLRLDLKDEAGSRADFDALLKLHPHQHGRIAAAYVRVERFDDAVAEYDSWIAAGPTDGELAEALTGRCQARAFWNHDLDKALADCDQADKLSPNTTDVLSSRGFVHLRLAQLDPAMSDFNAALRASPQDPWSLYGRGLVKQRKGQKADGDADIAAATAIMPRLPERAKTYGLTP
jgi:tetratricopeptide (TPR) repeat protein